MVTYFYLVKQDSDRKWSVFERGYDDPRSTFDAKDAAFDFARELAEERYVAEVHVFGAGERVEARQEFRLAA